MYEAKDIVPVVDYHDKHLVIRRVDCSTGEERLSKQATTVEAIGRVVADAQADAADCGGKVIWVMESTTGWARVRESLVSRRTALRNWIDRYLAHETWESRWGLWSAKGMRWLRGFAASPMARRPDAIRGGGTDKRLRHYIIEAPLWAREIPRYRPTYERVCARRGNKIGRLVVGRLRRRSIYKMLKEAIAFNRSKPSPLALAQ